MTFGPRLGASAAGIRIGAGALGAGLPERDLMVSPQHRVMVRSDLARELSGQDEVLVAAKHLLAVEGIEIVGTANDGVAALRVQAARELCVRDPVLPATPPPPP